MSTDLSFRAAFERQAQTPAEHHDPSFFPAEVRVWTIGPLLEPVSFALILRANGFSLKQAHAALDALTRDGTVDITPRTGAVEQVMAAIYDLNLGVERIGAASLQG